MAYKSPGDTSDVREEGPYLCAFDCFFPILDQSSATAIFTLSNHPDAMTQIEEKENDPMPDFVDGPKLSQRLFTALRDAMDVRLAVAFWGAGAAETLGIHVGVGARFRVVCNLSSGGTNPHEIRELLKRGVEVRQLNDLHAKIGVVDDLSFLGSSNMSTNGLGGEYTRTGWREANIVYQNARPEIASRFDDFWRIGTEITEADLKKAKAAWRALRKGIKFAAVVTDDFTGRLVGSTWTNEVARAAIPVIVAAARDGELLTYKDLDDRIHEANPGKFKPFGVLAKLAKPLGNISFTCCDMRNAFKKTGMPKPGKRMPPITAIIISKAKGLPGGGFQDFMDMFMEEIGKSKKAKYDPVWATEYMQKQVFKFKGWDALIEAGEKAESITGKSED